MRALFCLLCLIPTLVTAQSKGARTCRILFLGAPAGAPEKLHLFDGTSSQEVELPQMNLSPIYQLPSGPITLALLPAAASKPEDVSPDAPKATVAESITDIYLLVTSETSNKIAPVKFQVIDVNSIKFRKGQMLWFNLTPNKIVGKVGTQDLDMATMSKSILEPPSTKGDDYPVNLSFLMPDNERVYPLCETKWSHDPRARTMFFVVMQSGSRTPRIVGVPDYREAEGKEEKK